MKHQPSADHPDDAGFMHQALGLAARGIEQGDGGPFGALVVIDGKVVGEGWNQVVRRNDPTAHAEILAIRDACRRLGRFHLEDAVLYATCEPCPMCLAALCWARIETLVYAADGDDAAAAGFSDRIIRQALQLPLESSDLEVRSLLREDALALIERWRQNPYKTSY
jgi:tRNA(Arg) A34 adenosine deaminase TadA